MPDDAIQDDRSAVPCEGGARTSSSAAHPEGIADDRLWLRRTVEHALAGPAVYYWRFVGLVVLAVALYLVVRVAA